MRETRRLLQSPQLWHLLPFVDVWMKTYASPIAHRLNALAPGSTPPNIYALMLFCPFASLPLPLLRPLLCPLSRRTSTTTRGSGPRARGGYVNELLARLTRRPVSDRTWTNGTRTLDIDGETFPLGRGIYVCGPFA